MFKSKTMIIFVIFVLGVVYLGGVDTNNMSLDNDNNNIVIINE